jgi:hypothetical protein
MENTIITNSTPKTPRLILRNITPQQKSMLLTGGLSIGAFGTGAALSFIPKDTDVPGNTEGEAMEAIENCVDISIPTSAPFCTKDLDDLSFSEAFAAARNDIGKVGFFEWNGNTYNTFTKEEWESLDSFQQDDFIAAVNTNTEYHKVEPLVKGIEDENIAIAEENYQYGFYDFNKDGVVETMAIDKDGDGLAEMVKMYTNDDRLIIFEDRDFNNMYDTVIEYDNISGAITLTPLDEEINVLPMDALLTEDEARDYMEEQYDANITSNEELLVDDNDLAKEYHNL